MRAFIFSLDAFVAFTLALIAIYSLIFFSSVPSAYYYMLTQAHYLARDGLMAISTSACTSGECVNADGSVLDNIAFHTDAGQQRKLITGTIGPMVPAQFGYSVSISNGSGQPWVVLYNTSAGADPNDPHAKSSKKLTVSTQVMAFGYTSTVNKLVASPYSYGSWCGPDAGGAGGSQENPYWGTLITCGEWQKANADGPYKVPLGNVRPDDVLPGDAVPQSESKIVKLTIFI